MCAFVCLSGLSMQWKHQCAGKKCSLCGSMTTKHFSAVQAHPIQSYEYGIYDKRISVGWVLFFSFDEDTSISQVMLWVVLSRPRHSRVTRRNCRKRAPYPVKRQEWLAHIAMNHSTIPCLFYTGTCQQCNTYIKLSILGRINLRSITVQE
jgi:hypothetical protein